MLRVLAWTMAGLAYSVYGYADWIARMGVPFTAQDEFLFAWAALVGIYPKAATGASGHAEFTGSIARVIYNGTPLRRQDGVGYVTTADGVIGADGTATVPMTATELGAYTDCDPGTPISITTALAGVNSGGVTVGYTVGGADAETNDELRSRMLLRYRMPPQGGSAADYIQWALDVPGCTRAWVSPLGAGSGTVYVYSMFDQSEAPHGGFPQGQNGVAAAELRPATKATGDLALIADYIYPLQPVTAMVFSVAPHAYPVDVELIQLDPNTADMQTQIAASLEDVFYTEGAVGGTVLASGLPGGVIYPSQLYEAILATPGVNHFTMSSPALPIVVPTGFLPVLGTLTAPQTT